MSECPAFAQPRTAIGLFSQGADEPTTAVSRIMPFEATRNILRTHRIEGLFIPNHTKNAAADYGAAGAISCVSRFSAADLAVFHRPAQYLAQHFPNEAQNIARRVT